jgi:DNA-binding MarR family transcriptional regulator
MSFDLSTLLSQTLVAFTIEMDNEYEHQTIHRTTLQHQLGSSQRGPWLTSFAMYSNCLQFLGDDPISVRDLERSARTATNLDGMRRWGYISLSPPPERPNSKRPGEGWLIDLTPVGRMYQKSWRPLPELIEQRWRDRLGAGEVNSLRAALFEIGQCLDVAYPDFMPILGYGLFTCGKGPGAKRSMPSASVAPLKADSPLTALLSRLLCDFAYNFERDSFISLAISANLLRKLNSDGIRNRDLPQRTGVSKQSIAMAMGILQKAGLVEIGSSSGKLVLLTSSGLAAQQYALDLIADIEQRWMHRFGEHRIQRLRQALEYFVGDPTHGSSPLFQGLKPYPDNWRASTPQLQILPHFPMVLHRGGYPDGS